MAETSDLESLKNIILGLGLNALPKLLEAFHKSRASGKNVSEGRAPGDHGQAPAPTGTPGAGDLQSVLAPLLQQLGGQGGMPQNTPGMRPGNPPAPLPQMGSLPRTLQAGAGPGGL